jgi:hypothetical protein
MSKPAMSIVIRILLQWKLTFCVVKTAVFIDSVLSINPKSSIFTFLSLHFESNGKRNMRVTA